MKKTSAAESPMTMMRILPVADRIVEFLCSTNDSTPDVVQLVAAVPVSTSTLVVDEWLTSEAALLTTAVAHCLAPIVDLRVERWVDLPAVLDAVPLDDVRILSVNGDVSALLRPDAARHLQLRELRLYDCRGLNDDVAQLPNLSSLRVLAVYNCNITQRGIEAVRGCTILEELDVSCNREIVSLSFLSPCCAATLKVLRVSYTSVTDEGITALRSCTALEVLHIDDTEVTSLSALSHCAAFRILRASDCEQLTNDGIAALGHHPSLEEVALYGCSRISDVTPLSTSAKLRKLDLYSTSVDDAGVSALIGHPSLRVLDIRNTKASKEPFAHMTHLIVKR